MAFVKAAMLALLVAAAIPLGGCSTDETESGAPDTHKSAAEANDLRNLATLPDGPSYDPREEALDRGC